MANVALPDGTVVEAPQPVLNVSLPTVLLDGQIISIDDAIAVLGVYRSYWMARCNRAESALADLREAVNREGTEPRRAPTLEEFEAACNAGAKAMVASEGGFKTVPERLARAFGQAFLEKLTEKLP